MYSIEFDIEFDGETGRPRLVFPEDQRAKISNIENKFFAVEVTRALVKAAVIANEKANNNSDYAKKMSEVYSGIEDMANIFAISVLDKINGESKLDELFEKFSYDIHVSDMDELHRLNYNGIIYGDQIFKREIGLKVRVLSTNQTYELQNGIDNDNWTDITNNTKS